MLHGVNLWYNHPIALAVGVAWLQIGFGLALLTSNGVVGRVAGAGQRRLGRPDLAHRQWRGRHLHPRRVHPLRLARGHPLLRDRGAMDRGLAVDLFARRFSTVTLRIVAVVVALAIVVQSLPAAEFWHGGRTNALAAMTSDMTGVPQPHWLAWLVLRGGDLGALMGGGFNVAVIAVAGGDGGRPVALGDRGRGAGRVVSLAVGAVVFWIIGAGHGGLRGNGDRRQLALAAGGRWPRAPRPRGAAPAPGPDACRARPAPGLDRSSPRSPRRWSPSPWCRWGWRRPRRRRTPSTSPRTVRCHPRTPRRPASP